MVVDLGAPWRIGNGENISVWYDSWLRGRSDSFIRSPVVVGTKHLRVKDLWDVNTVDCNSNILEQLFNAQEVGLIKAMQRFYGTDEDQLSWWRSKSGQYSVCSAYYALMEEFVDNSNLRFSGDWMAIWRARIPPKVKLCFCGDWLGVFFRQINNDSFKSAAGAGAALGETA